MDYLSIIILGVVQGVAEFLPISSSGHLVILGELLNEWGVGLGGDTLPVNVVLHAGTLLSILVVYWQRIWRLLFDDRRVLGLLAIGTLPAAVVGVAITQSPQLEGLLENPLLTGCMLLVTAGLLLWSDRLPPSATDYTQMTWRQAALIGLVQAFAILPGISRSGATIVSGVAVGLRRNSAATFSFLLAIVAISGASFLEGVKLLEEDSSHPPLGVLAVGAAVAFACGVLALKALLRWLEQGRLRYFAYWCIAVGVPTIVWQLMKG